MDAELSTVDRVIFAWTTDKHTLLAGACSCGRGQTQHTQRVFAMPPHWIMAAGTFRIGDGFTPLPVSGSRRFPNSSPVLLPPSLRRGRRLLDQPRLVGVAPVMEVAESNLPRNA